MRFDEEPNLDYTRKLFRDLYEARGYDQVQGKMWDWEPSGAISNPAAASASAAAATTAGKKPAGVAERPSTTPVVEENPSSALERTQSAGGNNNSNKGSTAAKKRNNAESNTRTRGQKDANGADEDNESLEPKLGEEVGDTGLQTRPTTAGGLVEDGAMVVDNA